MPLLSAALIPVAPERMPEPVDGVTLLPTFPVAADTVKMSVDALAYIQVKESEESSVSSGYVEPQWDSVRRHKRA